jgi:hypothetical protein
VYRTRKLHITEEQGFAPRVQECLLSGKPYSVVKMQIRTTDCRASDLEDNIVGLGDIRNGRINIIVLQNNDPMTKRVSAPVTGLARAMKTFLSVTPRLIFAQKRGKGMIASYGDSRGSQIPHRRRLDLFGTLI